MSWTDRYHMLKVLAPFILLGLFLVLIGILYLLAVIQDKHTERKRRKPK